MKITRIDAFQVRWTPDEKPTQHSAFVRIHTDDGIDGISEASPMQGGLASLGIAFAHAIPNFESTAAYVNAVFLPVVFVSFYVFDSHGAPGFLRSIADAHVVVGPQVITRYNNYRAIPIQGSPSPGTSSGTALTAMEEVSQQTLPTGYGYEWTGTAYQEVAASGQTGAILGLTGPAYIWLTVTIVTSLPSRTTAAVPNGIR